MTYSGYRRVSLTPIWVIIGTSLILFIATAINSNLIFLLGLSLAGLIERPWTIMTNLFVHGSIWHIFANMFTLFFFGRFLYLLVGGRRFLLVYFIGGLLGNIFYLLLAPPLSIGIGASGAVFALGGALAVMRPRLKVIIFPIPAPLPLWVAVIGGFLVISFLPHIAWQAHLGGLVFGLIMGYFFRKRERYFF